MRNSKRMTKQHDTLLSNLECIESGDETILFISNALIYSQSESFDLNFFL